MLIWNRIFPSSMELWERKVCSKIYFGLFLVHRNQAAGNLKTKKVVFISHKGFVGHQVLVTCDWHQPHQGFRGAGLTPCTAHPSGSVGQGLWGRREAPALVGTLPLGQDTAPGSNSRLKPHLRHCTAGVPLLKSWEFFPPSGTVNSIWHQDSNVSEALIDLAGLSWFNWLIK